jgi:hypothetical protein
MAVSGKMYGNAILKAFNKEVNWASDTIKVMLCTSSYVPDQDAHIYKSSVTNEVAAGNGYTAGGATLAGKTIIYNGSTNTITIDANDVSWTNATITARYAVIYDDTGTASTSALLGFIDFGQDMASTNGTFQITWNASGIFTVTAA